MTSNATISNERQDLVDLAQTANQQLEEAGKDVVSRAFNLGCSVVLVPGMVLVGLVFVFSRANWGLTGIVALLVVMLAVGMANFAAYSARKNTIQRVYEEQVQPNIQQTLDDLDVSREAFDHLASQQLPEDALLQRYLSPPGSEIEQTSSSNQ